MKNSTPILVLAGAILLFSTSVTAGVHTDELSKCLVDNSTPSDKILLMKWLFASISLHPDIKPMASVSQEDIDGLNKELAELFVKLLTKNCKEQTKKAIVNEGEISIAASFNAFSQIAAKELFSHPAVMAGMARMANTVELNKLEELLE